MLTLERAQSYYTDTDPVHDFYHILRVLHLAERIATAEGADQGIVQAAVLLHDISREGEGEHGVEAARLVDEILPDAPPTQRQAIAHAIEAHRFSTPLEPRTLEAKVVFDADKLDSIGAVGVARAFAYAGKHHHPLYVPVPAGQPVTADQRDISAYHEYRYKLRVVRDRLYTPTAKHIAEERHAFMVAFFAQLAAEAAGER